MLLLNNCGPLITSIASSTLSYAHIDSSPYLFRELESSGHHELPHEISRQVEQLLKNLEGHISRLPPLPDSTSVCVYLEYNDGNTLETNFQYYKINPFLLMLTTTKDVPRIRPRMGQLQPRCVEGGGIIRK